jgi:hypothetical protein
MGDAEEEKDDDEVVKQHEDGKDKHDEVAE